MIKKYHLPLFFSQFLCIFSDGYIFIYKRDNNILKIKFIMEVIAILLFGILIINSLLGFTLICRIDKLIEINNKKEIKADE